VAFGGGAKIKENKQWLRRNNHTMEISEKDLEDLIYQDLIHKGGRNLISRGLNTVCMSLGIGSVVWLRQVRVEPYGIADIIGYRRYRGSIYVDIIELKNRPLECGDFDQVFRYKTAVLEMFGNSRPNMRVLVNCYIVGRDINSGHYIHNHSDVNLVFFTFSIHGFQFRTENDRWCKNEGTLTLKSWTSAQKQRIDYTPKIQNA
jgi:hypothetical protein